MNEPLEYYADESPFVMFATSIKMKIGKTMSCVVAIVFLGWLCGWRSSAFERCLRLFLLASIFI